MKFSVLALGLLANQAYANAKKDVKEAIAMRARALEDYPAAPLAKAHRGVWHRAVAPVSLSPDGSCGVVSSGTFTCKGSAFGSCCGSNKVCGSDAISCDVSAGCNPNYGLCDDAGAVGAVSAARVAAANSSSTMPVTTDLPSSITYTTPALSILTHGPYTNTSSTATSTPGFGNGGRSGSNSGTAPLGSTSTPGFGNGGRSGSNSGTAPLGTGASSTPGGINGTGSVPPMTTTSGSPSSTPGAPGSGDRVGTIATLPGSAGGVCYVLTRVHTMTA